MIRPRFQIFSFLFLVLPHGGNATSVSAADEPGSMEFFEKKIRPVLAEKCYRCHSAEAEKLKAGLQVDHLEHLLSGGDSGPALVAGKPDESLLVETIRYGNPDLQMPPKSKLADDIIADFERWIQMGAPWPEEPVPPRHGGGQKVDGSDMVVEAFDLEKRRAEHWCWQPISRPPLPTVNRKDWPVTGLDHFILARLEASELLPAVDAPPVTWLRRVYFDLVGLPPTPDQIDAFLAEKSAHPDSDTAEENVVEALLASPHFGERWARHWMDLARFGETCGHEFDYPIPFAWRYRDYLIDAFNRDLPYDQFMVEQIAGDLLENPRRNPDDGTDASIAGTGFWFLHEAVHAPTDIRGDEAGRIDNQIDVFSKSFLGLTVACARCHDHKFDAIGTADYYALAGYLQSSRRQEAFLDPGGKIKEAARTARTLYESGTPLLGEAFGSREENRHAGERFARYLLAADRLLTENAALPTSTEGEVIFENFENGYGDWKISGDAFGKAPASGPFGPNQQLSDFLGKGLVNTWIRSDKLTGRALSPEFVVEKPYLHFLVAGGNHPEQTAVRLLVEGKVVESVSGQNHDRLMPHTWKLESHRGKRARIEIVDEATGGWGHIDADHFVFSDRETFDVAPASRAFDPSLVTRIAKESGGLDETILTLWARMLRDEALDQPSHPFHAWWIGAENPAARQRLLERYRGEAKEFEQARDDAQLLADFREGDSEGWTSTGNSFGEPGADTDSPWAPGLGESLLVPADTLSTATTPTGFAGVLRSPTFELTHDHLHVRINARKATVRLVIDGHYMNRFHTLLLKGSILKNVDTDGRFQWLTMSGDLDKYLGHRVWLEITDASDGYVALDQVLLSDQPLPTPPTAAGLAVLSRVTGDSKEALATAYGEAWGEALGGFPNEIADAAALEFLNFTWGERLWQRNPDLFAVGARLRSIVAPEPLQVTALLEGDPENEFIHIRGSHLKLGDEVPRRNLAALGGNPAPEGESGRLQLARELVSESNPLVRRVIVNRVWHHLFGRGIVSTVDDFGVMGRLPSHPALLDYLASEFSGTQGWSMKSLIQEIVLSRTYRMSSAPHPGLDPERLAVVDPENILLHRAPVRRLQAEAIRDAILSVSGRLASEVGGESVPVHLTAFMEGRGRPGESGPLDGAGRRSLYAEIRRNFLPPFLLTFDMPIPFNAMGRRSVSNVPAQALALMNDPFVSEQARLWAERVAGDDSRSRDQKIDDLFLSAFAREPVEKERQQIESFLASEPDETQAWSDLCHALFNKKEFIFLN